MMSQWQIAYSVAGEWAQIATKPTATTISHHARWSSTGRQRARSMRFLSHTTQKYPKSGCARTAHGERSEEHTSELQSRFDLVCRLLLEKKKRRRGKRAGCCNRTRDETAG